MGKAVLETAGRLEWGGLSRQRDWNLYVANHLEQFLEGIGESCLPFQATVILDLLGEKAPAFYSYKILKENRPTINMLMRSLGMPVYNHLVFVVPIVLINSVVMPAPQLSAIAPIV
ncbi:hypothetical protein AOLI_G00098910 [Acnodon oligacanthus]